MSAIAALSVLVGPCSRTRSQTVVDAYEELTQRYPAEVSAAHRRAALVKAYDPECGVTVEQFVEICDHFARKGIVVDKLDGATFGSQDFGSGPQLFMEYGNERYLVP